MSSAMPKPMLIELGSIEKAVAADSQIRQLPDATIATDNLLESVARSLEPPGPSRNLLVVGGVGFSTADEISLAQVCKLTRSCSEGE
jgi:hypothetical protein